MGMPDESADSHYDEGLTAGMRGELSEAVNHFREAIHLDKSFSAAYHQLGKCYARAGKHEKAVEVLREVVKNRPRQMPARIDLAHALGLAGHGDEARNQLKQVLALEPSNAKALLEFARVEFYQGEWAAALAQAQAALTQGATNFGVLYLLGRAAKLAGDSDLAGRTFAKAADLIEKTLDIDEERPEGSYLQGELAFVQEQYDKALDHYRVAEERAQMGRSYLAYGEDFTMKDVLGKQGLCYQRLGQADDARKMGDRIGAFAPSDKLGKVLRETPSTE